MTLNEMAKTALSSILGSNVKPVDWEIWVGMHGPVSRSKLVVRPRRVGGIYKPKLHQIRLVGVYNKNSIDVASFIDDLRLTVCGAPFYLPGLGNEMADKMHAHKNDIEKALLHGGVTDSDGGEPD